MSETNPNIVLDEHPASPTNGAKQIQPIRMRRVPMRKQNGVNEPIVVPRQSAPKQSPKQSPVTRTHHKDQHVQHSPKHSPPPTAKKDSPPPPRTNSYADAEPKSYISKPAAPRGNGYRNGRGGYPNNRSQVNGRDAHNKGIPQTQRPSHFSVSDHLQVPVRRPQEPWRLLPEVSIKVSGLPPESTTLDLYNIFKEYGEIEYLEIFENGRGFRDGAGRVKFSPPPKEAFWLNSPMKVHRAKFNNAPILIDMTFEEPKRSYTIDSPVSNKILPEKFEFSCTSIDFGFMFEKSTMMSMFTTSEKSEVEFEANLRKRLLVVWFTHKFEDPPELPVNARMLARKDSFKFEIPFTMLESIYEDPESTPGKRIFILSLPSPASFWKKVHDVDKTHDDESRSWSERHSWFRQTDIVYDHGELREQPVAIKKKKPLIDLGRWTTYRITFDLPEKKQRDFFHMTEALGDFNVHIAKFEDFKRQSSHAARIWDIIDRPINLGSFAAELMADTTSLRFPLRYQLEVCISQGTFSEYNLTREFIERLLELEEKQKGAAIRLLEVAAETEIRYFDPMEIFDLKVPKDPKLGIPQYCSVMRKATITPTMIYFSTPSVETSNRVIRNYQEHGDRFLRVQFTDEKGQGKVPANDFNMMNEVYTRAKRALTNGITIGDRHFEFLAFGNSQLREHGAYFFSSTDHLSANDIRRWMGEFSHIKQVAKHAARLGQCFSTTFSINTVKVTIKEKPDIERNGQCFSDGCGMISEFVSQMIASELGLLKDGLAPSAYQFRLGGCKGVLAVSPQATLREVFIRPSQRKFNTTHNGLEIIRASHLATAYLNRQLIAVLKTLDVEDNVFMRKLTNQLENLRIALQDQSIALGLLKKHIDPNQATLHIATLILSGFFRTKEPFVMNLLQLWRAWSIKALKEKARIVVEDGAFVIGVVDEVGKLKGHYDITPEEEDNMTPHEKLESLPEIFLQINDPDDQTTYRVIEGVCLLARNPSLHPGDIRVVRAVRCEELIHLRNVVVLPQTGTRSLASMCSGGDLDGDDYIVIWDPEFVPTVVNHPPMDYSAPKPKMSDCDVKVADITSFFVNYMKMDRLGTIAHAHLAWSDYLEEGVKSPQCLRLAELHSMAVDFNKTGDPAKMEKDLRVTRWPHFMEKHPENPERTRVSTKILGKLYDHVEKINFVPRDDLHFDKRILNSYKFNAQAIRLAKMIKEQYDWAVRRIMGQHAIATEFEIYSTFVMAHSGHGSDYKYHEEIGQIRDGLKDRFRKVVTNVLQTRDEKAIGQFAVAMYQVTNDEYSMYKILSGSDTKSTAMPLISFPWLFAELLCKVAEYTPPFDDAFKVDDDGEPLKDQGEVVEVVFVTDATIKKFLTDKAPKLNYEMDTMSNSDVDKIDNPAMEAKSAPMGGQEIHPNNADMGADTEVDCEGEEVAEQANGPACINDEEEG